MGLRIVVAEDNLLVREGLVRLLSTAPDIEVAASCDDYDAVVAAVEEQQPDAVVTDIRMPPTLSDEGIRLSQELRRSHPEMGVVVVSQYSDAGQVLELFDGGSDRRAYLLKERLHESSPFASATAASPSNPASARSTRGLAVCSVVLTAPDPLSAKTITSPQVTLVIIARARNQTSGPRLAEATASPS